MIVQIAQIVQMFTNFAILGQIVRLCIITIFCSLAVILIVCKMQNVASGVKMLAIINSIDIKTGGQFHKLHFLSFANVVARRVGYIRYIKPASISFNFQNSIMSGLRNNYITRPAADIPLWYEEGTQSSKDIWCLGKPGGFPYHILRHPQSTIAQILVSQKVPPSKPSLSLV